MFGLGIPEGFGLIILFALFVLYFLPAVIAKSNKHSAAGAVFFINLLVGWTFLGWIACLVWAFVDSKKNKADIRQQ